MNPIRFFLGLLVPRHKALAAQCTTGSGMDVTVDELDRQLGITPEEAEALDVVEFSPTPARDLSGFAQSGASTKVVYCTSGTLVLRPADEARSQADVDELRNWARLSESVERLDGEPLWEAIFRVVQEHRDATKLLGEVVAYRKTVLYRAARTEGGEFQAYSQVLRELDAIVLRQWWPSKRTPATKPGEDTNAH